MMREDWTIVKLGEVCFTTSGGTPSRKVPAYYEGNIPWVKSGELNHNIIKSTEEYISEEAIKGSSAKIFPENTVLIALYGATIGKLAILGIPAATNQAVCGIYQNEIFEKNFLFNYLFHKKQQLIEQGAGGAQPNISQTILKKLPVPIVPLPEQRAIVTKIEELFSQLDKGIATLKEVKGKLEIYRQAVLKKAFEGELTKEWRAEQTNLPSANELLEQIKQKRIEHYHNQVREWEKDIKKWEEEGKKGKKPSKPGKLTIPESPNEEHNRRKWEIPHTWIWTQLGEIAFVTKLAGFEYTKYVKYDNNGDLSVIKAENAGPNGFKITNYSKVKTNTIELLTRSQLFGGELIIVFVGAGTGNVALVPRNQKFFLGPNIGMIRPYFEVNTRYLELFFRSAFGKNLMMTTVKAVAQPSLSMGTIRQSPVAFPSIQEQNQIINEIEPRLSIYDNILANIEESLGKAEALRQSILKKAFEGSLLSNVELDACRKEPDWESVENILDKVKKAKK